MINVLANVAMFIWLLWVILFGITFLAGTIVKMVSVFKDM